MTTFLSDSSQHGKATTWLFILILAAVAAAGFKIGQLHFDHATFVKEIEEMASDSMLHERFDLTDKISQVGRNYGILISPKDVKFSTNPSGSQIRINFSYSRTANLIVYQYPLEFEVDVTRDVTASKNIIDTFREDYESGSRGASQRYLDSAKESLK